MCKGFLVMVGLSPLLEEGRGAFDDSLDVMIS